MTGGNRLVNANDYASIVHTYEVNLWLVSWSGLGAPPPPPGCLWGQNPDFREIRGGFVRKILISDILWIALHGFVKEKVQQATVTSIRHTGFEPGAKGDINNNAIGEPG